MSAQKHGGRKSNQRKEAEPKKPVSREPIVAVSKPGDPPPLYRSIDWWTFAITTAVVMLAYWLTLAPDLTLEDSGELAVGSMYAGIPHPPGYPVWTLYTWFFAKFIPFSNIAWRVALGCALAGALSCGLLGLMVSRGSSMLIEGIESLKTMPEKWENAICLISGFVSGAIFAFNGYMWSQSVIVEVYSLSVLSLVGVLCCLLRWIYAPHQRRYLYWAMFIFGICFTNHQTLILAAMGIEVAILLADRRLGRDMFLASGIIYFVGLIAKRLGMLTSFDSNQMVFLLYHAVGISSLYVFLWHSIKSTVRTRWIMLGVHALLNIIILAMWMKGKGATTAEISNKNLTQLMIFLNPIGIGLIYGYYMITGAAERVLTEWKPVVLAGLVWLLGAGFYFYMPIAGMTNPPMQWGYPRTVEGFMHALTRGQYEKTNPTDLFNDPSRFIMQIKMLAEGVADEFSAVFSFIALVPFIFLIAMKKRERAWILGLTAVYLCLAVLLMILLNPSYDRQTRALVRVFFTSSHVVVAMMVGYGIALVSCYMATHYKPFRMWGIIGGGVAIGLGFLSLAERVGKTLHGEGVELGPGHVIKGVFQAFAPGQYGLPVLAGFLLVLMALAFVVGLLVYRERAPLALSLAIFASLPLVSAMSNWAENEQRGHLFGYWFGHDMFSPPFDIYEPMARDAILFGGTDPGRFCPTYMIFCESFIPARCKPRDPEFDRRDVYIITQNALADGTYLQYIRAHYNRSTQIDPPFFQELLRSTKERTQNYKTNFVARLAYNILDRPLLALGAKIEAKRRERGVYPPQEIYIPTALDSQNCFQNYLDDAQRRLKLGQLKPGENVNVAGGKVQVQGQVAVMAINGLLTEVIFKNNPTNEFYVEESFPLDWMYPHLTPYGIIMKINRETLPDLPEEALEKDHEFWSRYSERLIGNWITYDTPVKEIAEWVDKTYVRHNYKDFAGDRKFLRDDQAHKAFSKLRSSIAGMYSWRLGYGTTPCPPEFAPKTPEARERLMKEADFAFRQAFAFCPYSPEAVFRYVTLLTRTGRLEDALYVAKACQKMDPYNGQVVNLVEQLEGHLKNNPQLTQQATALQQLEQAWKADPSNYQAAFNLASAYIQVGQTAQGLALLEQLVNSPNASGSVLATAAQAYHQMGQTKQANELLDRILNNPNAKAAAVLAAAQVYVAMQNTPKLEQALQKLAELAPESPEAWYDLSAVKATLGKNSESLVALEKAISLSNGRLLTNPGARNLIDEAKKDARFTALKQNPEFKRLVGP